MVMVASQNSYSQGIYGLVSNLGSLVVRTIFQVSRGLAGWIFRHVSSYPLHPRGSLNLCAVLEAVHGAFHMMLPA